MDIISRLKPRIIVALKELYREDFADPDLTLALTKPEFDGDYTLVLFSFVKRLKRSPEQLGKEVGEYLVKDNPDLIKDFNVIKGFLNLNIPDSFWISFLEENYSNKDFGFRDPLNKRVIVEYSSPNTNKPIHLGHLRNNFLGWSVAEILKRSGYDVIKTCISNDRGIHICKSMIAWELYSNGATPENTGIKGDHFVGNYYVLFNEEYKKQVDALIAGGMNKDQAEKEAPLMRAAQQMLVDWEAGKPEVIALWKKMNGWVYEGFEVTYKRIGSDFTKNYYESETYLPGKKFVEEGLAEGVFFKKPDGGVWIDLTSEGLDEKLVLRKDGTSVYITQDLGLAQQKFEEFHYDQSIYVIADEQNYHMKVLKLILQKLGKPYANGIYHLSYGMVELPTGRMKGREGTVVDADDLIDEMVDIASQHTNESGKVRDFQPDELKELFEMIGLGALKFFLLRVDPKKRMLFNPEESVDFHGFTGPFVQYTHARIKSILRKAGADDGVISESLLPLEKAIILSLEQFPAVIAEACAVFDPSVIAIYVFNLAKSFNTFYSEHSVMNAESPEKKRLRLRISAMTAQVIASAMGLLGIKVPERM